MLDGKSLTELRQIAQGYGVSDIFQKTDVQLKQAISLKQKEMQPKPEIVIPKPEYDARLMTKPPGKKSDRDVAEEVLVQHIARGLKLSFPNEEEWHMSFDNREDTGTIRMPPRVILMCADKIMK